MSYFLFIVRSALEDFRRNKMQTFLTSLGILIGVFAVVTLTAMGLGLKKYISDQFDALGTNTLFVAPGKLLQSGGFGASSLLGNRFDLKDLNRLKRIRSITAITPLSSKSGEAKGTKKSEFVTIFFSSDAFFDISGFEIDKGRFLDKSDIDKRAKVLVAGPKIAEKLFAKLPHFILGQTTADRTIRVNLSSKNLCKISVEKLKVSWQEPILLLQAILIP